MPPRADDPTDENVAYPWRDGVVPVSSPLLHLVTAWFLNEPDRTGESARVDRPSWLGRGSGSEEGRAALAFQRQRPGKNVAAPPLESTALSRRQLLIDPEGSDGIRVRCVGKRPLLHNGVETTECVARAGDTLTLEVTAVFVLESRPPVLPPLLRYRAADFAFGSADPDGLVGESPAAWALREILAAAGAADDHVLVTGESGAGKELAAAVVHRLSPRKAGPFVARNAATLPSGLVDAELFGAARNYPNAGSPEREGLVGAANGGTLLLDEIGELPEEQQARLLRVLDRDAEYHRLGESRARRSDFRLVAATNRDPKTLKHDFLARFGMRVPIPGLTERRSDIPFLASELLRRIAERSPDVRERFFEKNTPRLTPDLVDVLVRHPYTHHARELQRLLLVSIASSTGTHLMLTPAVFDALRGERASTPPGADGDADDEKPIDADRIAWALRQSEGNVSHAAVLLGISRHALRRLMKRSDG